MNIDERLLIEVKTVAARSGRPMTAVIEDALLQALTTRGSAHRPRLVAPGDRHWSIFERLCRSGNAKGNLVADAFHAALAIESGAEFITTDRDFSRFPGLRWRHPLGATS